MVLMLSVPQRPMCWRLGHHPVVLWGDDGTCKRKLKGWKLGYGGGTLRGILGPWFIPLSFCFWMPISEQPPLSYVPVMMLCCCRPKITGLSHHWTNVNQSKPFFLSSCSPQVLYHSNRKLSHTPCWSLVSRCGLNGGVLYWKFCNSLDREENWEVMEMFVILIMVKF
jgi:hypothetical protein